MKRRSARRYLDETTVASLEDEWGWLRPKSAKVCDENWDRVTFGTTSSERKRMLIICPYPQGVAAGQRLKYEQYFDDWRELGFDIEVSSYMDMATWTKVHESGSYLTKARGVFRGHFQRICDMFRVRQYDIVYVFMWVTPLGTTLFERLSRRFAKALLVDVEDNVLAGQSLPAQLDPNALLRWLKGPGKARYLIRTADHVITSSPFLNDFCLTLNVAQRCTYISSSVDTDRFLPTNRYSNERVVTIGWTGTFSSRMYLDMLRGVFQELARRLPFRLKLIANFDYKLDGVELEVVRWTKAREVEDLQSFDIGVYPLPINDWVLGKSGLKAIQYMAFGLPTVATEVGTTPLIITHGVNGLLVRNEEEWVDALDSLIRDPALRRRLGQAARVTAVERHSTKVVAKQYRQVLQAVSRSAH